MKCNITKRLGLFASALLFAVMQASGSEDTNLYYQVFAFGTLFDRVNPSAPPCDSDMKADLSSKDAGITWPIGSMAVMVIDDTDYLVVRNTHSNLNRIRDALWSETRVFQIVLESTIVAFKTKDIEDLKKGKGVSKDSLFELVRKGRSDLISTARSITSSGQEMTVKNVRVTLYPDTLSAGCVTNRPTDSNGGVLPEKFTVRETGSILTAVPERQRDGLIGIIVKSDWTHLENWEKHEAVISAEKGFKTISLKTPVIDSSTVETQLRIAPGETVLLGGGKLTSGDRILYHFLKAEVATPERVQPGGGEERR